MALGLSFIEIDVGKAAPLIGVAAVGLAGWYIWSHYQKQKAETAANPVADYQAAQDLALLQSFTGGSSVPTQATTAEGTTVPLQNPALPTYSAPGNPSQNFTVPALAGMSLGNASTNSNGI